VVACGQDRAAQPGAGSQQHKQGDHGAAEHIHRQHFLDQVFAQQQPAEADQGREQDQQFQEPDRSHQRSALLKPLC